MKTPLQFVALGGAVLVVAGCCTFLNLHCGRVNINEYDIEIYPGTKISCTDQETMDGITAKYDKTLWRVTDIDNKHVTTNGKLKDVNIEQTLFSEMTSAITHGVSHRTVQTGLTAHPDHTSHPNHTNHPNRLQRASHPNYAQAKQMVDELRPVLEKYSHK